MRELRLHLGAHKTATTHLQQILARRTAALAARGLAFVPPPAFRLALRKARRWRHLDRAGVARRLAAELEAIAAGAEVLAISDENLIGDTRGALAPRLYPELEKRLAVLADLAAGAEIHVFLAIRGFDRFWPSAFAEALRHHPMPARRVAALEARALADPPSWLEPIARIRAVLPGARLTVWRYEDHRAHWRELARAFLGRDPGPLRDQPPPRWTVSPNAEAVRAAARLVLPLPKRLHRRRVGKLYAAHPAGQGEPFAPFSPEAVRRLQERYAADLAALRAEGLLLEFEPEAAAVRPSRPRRRARLRGAGNRS
jgi:hypothetical protein